MRFNNLPGRKYISGFDTFIRHRLVADLAKNVSPCRILDVGGEGALKMFIPGSNITTANIKAADIIYSGGRLPLADNSFDMVVSLDTLEHIPQEKRTEFLLDLYRVSNKSMIICAPLGTPEHMSYEKIVLNACVLSGNSNRYLDEHVKFGLPTPQDVAKLAGLFKADVWYQGDYRELEPAGNISKSSVLCYLLLLLQTLKNLRIDLLWNAEKYLSTSSSPYTNRFFMVAEK